MNKVSWLLITASAFTGVMLSQTPLSAQQINPNAKEKVKFYTAPRQIQIIDDRPIIRDFREAPAQARPINLPPGPVGTASGFGGGGAGALGPDGGTLPSGGMPLSGGSDPGYRSDPAQANSVPLDKADFGHRPSNIPAGGIRPKGPLPGGFSTGVHAQLKPFEKTAPIAQGAGPARGMSRPASHAASRGPEAASYGGGYGGDSSAGNAYGSGGSSTAVKGVLLNRLKGSR
jgi:hypothetical protein